MFIRSFALIFFSLLAVYWFHIRIDAQDIIKCEQLLQESAEIRAKNALADAPASQLRHKVQKDIWSQNETRHVQIQSEESQLILQKNEQLEGVEELKNLRCTLEDDLILTAEEGIYAFPSHSFSAQKNCHLAKEDNYIDGTFLDLNLEKGILTYDNPVGHLSSGPFDFTAKKLTWYKKTGKILLEEDVTIYRQDKTIINAEKATLALHEFEPLLFEMEGHVQLISSELNEKKSFAIADKLIYHPIEETLVFSSAKRVLFWQDGLSLSAPEVLISKDQSVVGLGDVHLSFDLEEQNSINALFKQYL
jgi:hypothetical protein